MIKDLPPPTDAEEYRNTAEILRDLAAQARFGRTRNELFNFADNLDRLATLAEHGSQVTSEQFTSLSDGSVRTHADAAVTLVPGRPAAFSSRCC
jgi:hypothetical protein